LCSRTDTVEAKARILADPRLKASKADFEEQHNLLVNIESTVRDLHQSVNKFRSVKKQLNNRLVLLKEMKGKEELVKIGETALENITKWEEQLIQPKQETFQDVINFRNQLNAELFQLRGMIDTHTPKPTDGTKERLKELISSWESKKAEMDELITKEIGGFNEAYQSRNMPALIIPED